MTMATVEFPQLIERGAGLDVHKDTVVATIRGTGLTEETKTFGTFTCDLERLIVWLKAALITHVAMESTGVYWKPVYYVLEGHVDIILVNARHIKNVPGHKTDKKDSEWIAQLLLSGLLKRSFVPDAQTRQLRVLYRHRKKLINQRSREKNRLQNILEDANIKLGSVVSDVFSKTGQAIIKHLIQGVTDPIHLSTLAKGSLVRKKSELEKALHGRFSDHHRFMAELIMDTIDSINVLISRIEIQIARCSASIENDIGLLQTIPGVSHQSAIGIVSEIGTDMTVFPSSKHLASWAGVCPGTHESAGKKKSSRVTEGNNYLKTTLIEASWAGTHTLNTHFAFKYNKLSMRRGKKKAAMAIGHDILVASYHILRDKVPYREPKLRPEILLERKRAEMERLEKRLEKLKTLASSI
jgi:transposase